MTDVKIRQENGRIKVINRNRYAADSNTVLQPLLSYLTGLPIEDCPPTVLAIEKLTANEANDILQALGVTPPLLLKEKRIAVQWEFMD